MSQGANMRQKFLPHIRAPRLSSPQPTMNGSVLKPMANSRRCKPAAPRPLYERQHYEATAAFRNLTTTIPPALVGPTVAFHRERTKKKDAVRRLRPTRGSSRQL